MEDFYDGMTKLPTHIDDEDVILAVGPIRLSLRQILLILMGFVAWIIARSMTTALMPISGLFAGLLWIWLLIAAVAFALVKRDGRPLEEWLTRWLTWKTSPQRYILRESKKSRRAKDVEDADWFEISDDDFHAPSF
jgi:hypothetical protein